MAGNPDSRHPEHETLDDATRRSLTFGRMRMRFNLAFGRLLTLAAPALGVIALFLSLSWFGVFRMVPDWIRIGLLAVFALGFVASLWPLSRFRNPSREEIDTRLEAENRIANQAIASQDDEIAASDPVARALWVEHRRRMAARIGALESGIPRSTLPQRDPWGLRVAVGLLLFVAFFYSYSGHSGRPGDAFVSHVRTELPDVRIDAWVTPPSYVSQAPVFLTGVNRAPGEAVSAIAGSEVTVRLGGASGDTEVAWTPAAGEPSDLEQSASPSAPSSPSDSSIWTFKPQADGVLSIHAGRSDLDFALQIIPDEPPVAAFVETPRRAVNGALELDYTLSDDHGLASAEAEIVPAEEPSPTARPLFDPPKYRLSLPRRSSENNRAVSSHDLTEHPLAGQKVRITLVATDGAGQEGRSETLETTMPGRRFSNQLAAAVVEQRGILALDAQNLPRVFDLHDALTIAPEETIPDLSHYLLLESVRGRLENARSDEDLRAAIDYMWGVALQIEDGNLSLAERRLRDAQNALAEALENGASDEEIAQLMDELREAMQEFLQEMARQMENSPSGEMQQQAMPENMLRQRDLDNMLDQIENLARSGARDQAQQMLQELQRMMNNLQAGRQQRQQQQGGPMRQQMDKLGELMRQQQQLMDETMRADREQQGQSGEGRDRQQQGQRQPGQGQDQGQQGEGGQSLEEMLGALGRSQQELQDALGQLQRDLEGLGINPSEGFGEAGEAMGDATGNLQQGQTGQALGDQGRALQALRQGAEDMMNQMMQAMGNQPGDAEGDGPDQNGNRTADDRDPLGRPRSTTGPDFGSRVEVPDEIDIQRARRILDAIRERLGDQLSPELEKRYLERLLDLQ
ncbi:TIGR02302 family protein [Hoeflea sp.]|uniref:TIGR02302 family protein n=1 Tax=Hoeflea sp. TaxID=1940281 RepID=UPI003B52F827